MGFSIINQLVLGCFGYPQDYGNHQIKKDSELVALEILRSSVSGLEDWRPAGSRQGQPGTQAIENCGGVPFLGQLEHPEAPTGETVELRILDIFSSQFLCYSETGR